MVPFDSIPASYLLSRHEHKLVVRATRVTNTRIPIEKIRKTDRRRENERRIKRDEEKNREKRIMAVGWNAVYDFLRSSSIYIHTFIRGAVSLFN